MTKGFFEQDPPPGLDQRILQAAERALAENRAAVSRRRFFQWFLVPAFSAAAAAVFVWRWPSSEHGGDLGAAAEFIDWKDFDVEDQELVADLEFVEDLDVLEEMEDT